MSGAGHTSSTNPKSRVTIYWVDLKNNPFALLHKTADGKSCIFSFTNNLHFERLRSAEAGGATKRILGTLVPTAGFDLESRAQGWAKFQRSPWPDGKHITAQAVSMSISLQILFTNHISAIASHHNPKLH